MSLFSSRKHTGRLTCGGNLRGRVNSVCGSDITQVPVVSLTPQAVLMYLPPCDNRNHICERSQLHVLGLSPAGTLPVKKPQTWVGMHRGASEKCWVSNAWCPHMTKLHDLWMQGI